MEYIGKLKITEELILNNPTATIKKVSYDWENLKLTIEVIFQEESSLLKNSRSFIFNIEDREYNLLEVKEIINSHPVLGKFNF